MVVFGLSRSFLVSLVALAVSGGADMVNVVIRQTLVQLETPDAMRGRVSAVNSIFIGASNQLGEFESGATAALPGAVGSVVLGGVGTLVDRRRLVEAVSRATRAAALRGLGPGPGGGQQEHRARQHHRADELGEQFPGPGGSLVHASSVVPPA